MIQLAVRARGRVRTRIFPTGLPVCHDYSCVGLWDKYISPWFTLFADHVILCIATGKAERNKKCAWNGEVDTRSGYLDIYCAQNIQDWEQIRGHIVLSYTLVHSKQHILGQTQEWFRELSFSRLERGVHDRLDIYTMCGIVYFPWHAHQIEGTIAIILSHPKDTGNTG